jgi:hypothetical protein
MAQWEYTTIAMGTPDNKGRRWVITAPDAETLGQQIGEAEKPRFIARFWQGMRLLETALKAMDAEGWELVSYTYSSTLFYLNGTAILRRPANEGKEGTS